MKKLNIIKKMVVFSSAIFLTNCFTSKTIPKQNDVDDVKIILDSTLELFDRKTQVPFLAKKAFESVFSEDKKLADKGGFFTETDLHTLYLPNRRLILGGKKDSNHIGFIVYETGGSIYNPSCIIYFGSTARQLKHILIISFRENVRDISSIRSAILLKQFETTRQIDF